jgi:hypothetical protein
MPSPRTAQRQSSCSSVSATAVALPNTRSASTKLARPPPPPRALPPPPPPSSTTRLLATAAAAPSAASSPPRRLSSAAASSACSPPSSSMAARTSVVEAKPGRAPAATASWLSEPRACPTPPASCPAPCSRSKLSFLMCLRRGGGASARLSCHPSPAAAAAAMVT